MKNERESNIELLRILSIVGIIILHYNNKFIGGAFEYVNSNSINYYILNILESTFICAVNIFIVISGFFLYNTEKRNLWKIIKLILQVIIIYELKYLGSIIINKESITLNGIFSHLIPSNYFVILYIVIYIILPYINILIKSLNKKETRRFVLIMFGIFSIYPTAIDLFQEITQKQYNGLSSIGLYGSQYGYTCVNFLLCYIIGAYIAKYKDIIKNINLSKLLIIYGTNILILTVWSLFNEYIGYYIEKSALEYCNPLIIINAATIFIMFMKIKIYSNVINKLAKASFTVFLIHDIFITRIKISRFVNEELYIMLLHIIISISVIYIIGYIWYILYSIIEKLIFKKLENKLNLSYAIIKQENISEKI